MKYKESKLISSLRHAAVGATKDTYLIINSCHQQFRMASAQLGVNRGWLSAKWYGNEEDSPYWKLYFTQAGLIALQPILIAAPKPLLNLVLGYPVDPEIRAYLDKIKRLPVHHADSANKRRCHWCHLLLWVEKKQQRLLKAHQGELCCPFCTVSLYKQNASEIRLET